MDSDTIPAGHSTYELTANVKGISTQNILASENVTADRLISTASTGTAPLTVASTTAVTNLNADMVDGIHGSSLARGLYKSGTTAATAGWYRIATSAAGIAKCGGLFTIEATVTGAHSVTTLYAGCTYGTTDGTVLNVLGHTYHGNQGITKARIVYHTTYTGNYAYLEVYIPTDAARTIYVNASGTRGWSLTSAATAGSIPSGYTSKTVTLYTRSISTDIVRGGTMLVTATTASTSSTTGALRVSGGVGVAGSLVAGGEITANSDARLKTDIQTLKSRGRLTPRTFVKDGKSCIGFIAQEVKELYPELVTASDTPDRILSLNYGALTAVLQAQANDMENEIKELKKMVERLSAQVRDLKK
ncbi:tail fiber domain-containing protein [Bacteroides sp. OttesenSCG-928-J23]|nr:tail fiber domain-containing protein [Bacteroides sp. OttesenSCG-928-J23]MDL2305994.1 tail fiber domain-containing protein [Bacteroides sp. OttesenSCG-928-D19]